jgi:hypothetical protein
MNASVSPYSTYNVDAAIVHLERVLSAEVANSLFGQTYWRRRVQQISATHGLHREQRMRLDRLMKLLADNEPMENAYARSTACASATNSATGTSSARRVRSNPSASKSILSR